MNASRIKTTGTGKSGIIAHKIAGTLACANFRHYRDSILGRASDVVLDVSVEKEACPLGLSATTNTTAALAMGDALAMVVMAERGTTREEFQFLHSGGAVREMLRKEKK